MSSTDAIVRRVNDTTGLTKKSAEAIIASLDTTTVSGCQGMDVREIASVDVTLLTLIIDGSWSMHDSRDVVKQCHKEMIAALGQSEFADGIVVSCWIFNSDRRLVHGFRPVSDVPVLEYSPEGETALYDTVLAALTGQLSYTQELHEDGALVKNVVIVFSDGGDNASRIDEDGAKVRMVAQDLCVIGDYVLAYVGFGESGQLNERATRALAKEIGFPEVIAAGKNEEGIKRLFTRVTDSVIKVSTSTSIQLVKNGFFGG